MPADWSVAAMPRLAMQRMLWRALSAATAGETYKRGNQTLQSLTWGGFCDAVAKLAPDTLWRHNQAGDLPGQGDND